MMMKISRLDYYCRHFCIVYCFIIPRVATMPDHHNYHCIHFLNYTADQPTFDSITASFTFNNILHFNCPICFKLFTYLSYLEPMIEVELLLLGFLRLQVASIFAKTSRLTHLYLKAFLHQSLIDCYLCSNIGLLYSFDCYPSFYIIINLLFL